MTRARENNESVSVPYNVVGLGSVLLVLSGSLTRTRLVPFRRPGL
jgi:hypothetical protein